MNLVTGPGIIVTVILICLVYRKLTKNIFNNIVKYIVIILLLALSYTFILQNTYTYMCREETYENYYTVSNNIYTRASLLDGYTQDKKWMFSDIIRYIPEYANRANGFISNDNETWDNVDGTFQNTRFFKKYLGIDIEMCSKEERLEIGETEEFKEMPIYPNEGSIKIINDIIVVKTSNEIRI